ncbi:MAG: hypothetical protein ACFE9L_05230 [Candidatus Hodarchaeota archaeon]
MNKSPYPSSIVVYTICKFFFSSKKLATFKAVGFLKFKATLQTKEIVGSYKQPIHLSIIIDDNMIPARTLNLRNNPIYFQTLMGKLNPQQRRTELGIYTTKKLRINDG